MISAIINFSIRNKLLVVLMLAGLVAWGVFSAASLPLDAIPDVTNNQVQVITQSPRAGGAGSRAAHHRAARTAVAHHPGRHGNPVNFPLWVCR